MEYLEIRPKFRCLEEYEAFNESQLCLPFKSTIDYINKIALNSNHTLVQNDSIDLYYSNNGYDNWE